MPADIRALALDEEKAATAINLQNGTQESADASTMSAQAQVVRADLDLPSVPN